MIAIIENGAGDGKKLGINDRNQAKVTSESITHLAFESRETNLAFIVATGFISLLSADGFSSILHFKNTDTTKNFYIDHFRVCAGLCAAGSTLQVNCYIGSTGGTLISDANLATTSNMAVSANKPFLGDAYTASASGKTISGGTFFTQFINHAPGHSIQEYGGGIILGTNDSFQIELKPSVDMTACIELIGWFE